MLATQAMTQQSGMAVIDPALDAASAKADLALARKEGEVARRRAEKLEAHARKVSAAAESTAQKSAAIAARIQETDAAIALHKAQIHIIASQRTALQADLAEKQGPLANLTGALQRLTRRPPLLALLRPGSVQDAVYMRAIMDTMLPDVEQRTLTLRQAIERGRVLEQEAQVAAKSLLEAQVQLRDRRAQLVALETRQRIEGREATGNAAREGDLAVALAEKARDLSDLVQEVGRQGRLRDRLSTLPGAIARPIRPEDALVGAAAQFAPPPEGLLSYQLPVVGRVVTGFGEDAPGQSRSRGLVMAPREQAQAIAPAPGRVAFAGPYRGYRAIVIIEHEGGWTTLVTGLARLNVAVGDTLVAGSPLGIAGPGHPEIMVELRRDGVPVNPLQYIRSL